MICENCGHDNPEQDHPYYEHAGGPLEGVYKNAIGEQRPVDCGACLYANATGLSNFDTVVAYVDPHGFKHIHGYRKKDGR